MVRYPVVESGAVGSPLESEAAAGPLARRGAAQSLVLVQTHRAELQPAPLLQPGQRCQPDSAEILASTDYCHILDINRAALVSFQCILNG